MICFFHNKLEAAIDLFYMGKEVNTLKPLAEMQNETRLMFVRFAIKLLEDFDRLTTASKSKQSKAHEQCFAPSLLNVYDIWSLQKFHFAVSLEVLKEASKK